MYWIYRAAFTSFRLGYASAMSVVRIVILVLLSVVQLCLLRDREA